MTPERWPSSEVMLLRRSISEATSRRADSSIARAWLRRWSASARASADQPGGLVPRRTPQLQGLALRGRHLVGDPLTQGLGAGLGLVQPALGPGQLGRALLLGQLGRGRHRLGGLVAVGLGVQPGLLELALGLGPGRRGRRVCASATRSRAFWALALVRVWIRVRRSRSTRVASAWLVARVRAASVSAAASSESIVCVVHRTCSAAVAISRSASARACATTSSALRAARARSSSAWAWASRRWACASASVASASACAWRRAARPARGLGRCCSACSRAATSWASASCVALAIRCSARSVASARTLSARTRLAAYSVWAAPGSGRRPSGPAPGSTGRPARPGVLSSWAERLVASETRWACSAASAMSCLGLLLGVAEQALGQRVAPAGLVQGAGGLQPHGLGLGLGLGLDLVGVVLGPLEQALRSAPIEGRRVGGGPVVVSSADAVVDAVAVAAQRPAGAGRRRPMADRVRRFARHRRSGPHPCPHRLRPARAVAPPSGGFVARLRADGAPVDRATTGAVSRAAGTGRPERLDQPVRDQAVQAPIPLTRVAQRLGGVRPPPARGRAAGAGCPAAPAAAGRASGGRCPTRPAPDAADRRTAVNRPAARRIARAAGTRRSAGPAPCRPGRRAPSRRRSRWRRPRRPAGAATRRAAARRR